MTPPTTRRSRRPAPAEPAKQDQGTRRQLLEAAGQVFAEHGFDRATGKEICQRAGADSAAINYYFGGMTGLHAAVLEEAHNQFVSLDALTDAVAARADAKAKLRKVLELFARAATGPAMSSWALRVLGREFVAPSPALQALDATVRLPRAAIMKGIVGELMGLPAEHPAVARGCVSVMAPCIVFLIADRATLGRVFPSLGLSPDDAPAVADHLTQFALAGLAAVAASAKKPPVRRTAR